jgi:tRNA threonylcarbamoyladenosine biosynthesis protein TsaB
MAILALDTCLDACSVAVLGDGVALAQMSEPMSRGHQERLAPMVAEAMTRAGLDYADLSRIAVTVGPGSFTGLRVGLAFGKAIALALGVPCIGVGVLQALAASARRPGFVAVCVDARRGQVYLQAFSDGRAIMAPDALEPGLAAARLAELWPGVPGVLIGSGAALVASVLPGVTVLDLQIPDPIAIAELARAARAPFASPRPLYLRAPDAKPSGGLTPA